jgi:hypothetical protein
MEFTSPNVENVLHKGDENCQDNQQKMDYLEGLLALMEIDLELAKSSLLSPAPRKKVTKKSRPDFFSPIFYLSPFLPSPPPSSPSHNRSLFFSPLSPIQKVKQKIVYVNLTDIMSYKSIELDSNDVKELVF